MHRCLSERFSTPRAKAVPCLATGAGGEAGGGGICFVFVSSAFRAEIDVVLERTDAGSDKNNQVGSTGVKYDCRAKNGTPMNNGLPCGLTIIVESRKR
ncbi:hypothetical protein MRX96_045690 [Rhipicephalus microplus]